MTPEDINKIIETLQITKLRKAGKFSNRNKGAHSTCDSCRTEHQTGRYPANGKTCFTSSGKKHFARAPACPNKKSIKKINSDYFTTLQKEVTLPDMKTIKKIHTPLNRWVKVNNWGTLQTLYANTRSEYTIITHNTTLLQWIAAKRTGQYWNPQNNIKFDIHVRKIINLNNSPHAIIISTIQKAAANNRAYHNLIDAITQGKATPPP